MRCERCSKFIGIRKWKRHMHRCRIGMFRAHQAEARDRYCERHNIARARNIYGRRRVREE
jgi:hypothetical protein